VEDVNGGTRIISTGVVSVSFDDIDAIKDARDEATLEAKSLISGFMSEMTSSDQTIDKAVRETKSMQGDTKAGLRKEVIERVKSLRSSTQNLLKGVVLLGECYTKGKEFRASVGVKPEFIAAAEKLSKSIANQPSSNSVAPSPELLRERARGRPGARRDKYGGNSIETLWFKRHHGNPSKRYLLVFHFAQSKQDQSRDINACRVVISTLVVGPLAIA
jgi:hypothetical protein